MVQDNLFSLIKTLTKSEKRKFKIFTSKSIDNSQNLYVELFDAIDNLKEYDDKIILKKNKQIKPTQLPNLKVHLYKIILTCLRLIDKEKFKSIEIREEIDYAKILYNKGLYRQSLKIIEKIKILCEEYHENILLFDVLDFEKKIELRHITGSSFEKSDKIINQVNTLSKKITKESQLSNLCLNMYGLYLKVGLVKSKKDSIYVENFFRSQIINLNESEFNFNEKVNFHQAYTWYYYIQQNFLLYYRHAQKWSNCYANIDINDLDFDIESYLKANHHLFNSLFFLSNGERLETEIKEFDKVKLTIENSQNFNLLSQFFCDIYFAKINLYFLNGNFKEGVNLIPEIEQGLIEYTHQLDNHKILIFYYKIAGLYFGDQNYEKCIDYLNKIINLKIGDIRTDLQCFSRMLHLVAHFELENYDIIDYLIKSLYRFLLKYKNNSESMVLIINFLKLAIKSDSNKIILLFKTLLKNLKNCLKDPYEKRTFLYLDLISYLESRIYDKKINEIIKKKYITKSSRF